MINALWKISFLTEKGVSDLFLHGTIESSTANVHQAFNTALNLIPSACRTELYKKMAQKRLVSHRAG